LLIAIIGGKLQGVEAVYLAQKSGWETLVIDKNPDTPAAKMCDHFLAFEFSSSHPVPKGSPDVDLILPAVEDIEVLAAVHTWAELKQIPLAFDLEAYSVSNSKLTSNTLFRKLKLPIPASWPDCNFPVVVKPDTASGSQDVEVIYNSKSFMSWSAPQQRIDNLVIQEFIHGPSYSIEVVGQPGQYQVLQVTDLSMDKMYDCKRVMAPTVLESDHVGRFKKMALALAEAINLKGIMDIEVVLNDNELKLLEIDARLPSQTPIAVYWSTGINMVEMLGNLFLNGNTIPSEQKYERFTVVEHLLFSDDNIEICGEHIMVQDGPLALYQDFFGADEAITSFSPEKTRWVATLIFTSDTYDDVTDKRKNCYKQIHKLSHQAPNGCKFV